MVSAVSQFAWTINRYEVFVSFLTPRPNVALNVKDLMNRIAKSKPDFQEALTNGDLAFAGDL